MKNELYESIKKQRFEARTRMAQGKAKEYAKDEDRLYNFKKVGQLLDLEPITVAGVLWCKHVFSVLTYIKKNQRKQEHQLSEPIEGRIQDAQEYLDIIAALITEAESGE
jgi:hypothetical protein